MTARAALGITNKQEDMLCFVGAFFERNGFAPTYKEIAANLGMSPKSRPAVGYRLQRLADRGYLVMRYGVTRSIASHRCRRRLLQTVSVSNFSGGSPAAPANQAPCATFGDGSSYRSRAASWHPFSPCGGLMQLRGAISNKSWKQRLRKRAEADLVDLRARHVVVEGVQHNVKFSFVHEGIHIGDCETVALYFEGGRRIAILRKSGNDELDALHGRLLKAFYSIEVRT